MTVAATAARETPTPVQLGLLDPGVYPHRVEKIKVVETHLSWVFLAGAFAYKVKKPIDLDFVQQADPDRRRELCFREVQLNSRLASGIYLGVRGLASDGVSWRLTDPHADDAVEWAVEMRRFDEADTLAARVREGTVTEHDIERVGMRVAWFHRDLPALAPRAPVDAFVKTVHQNLAELDSLVGAVVDRRALAAAQRFAASFAAGKRDELDQRARAGLVRAGHGDMRAEHVVLAEHGVEIFDCLEFDDGMRETDVGADLAFLAMELEALGRPDLASKLVASYREAGGDPGDADVFAFFVFHRAWVRCKVALLRRRQLPPKSSDGGRLRMQAARLGGLAHTAAWRARGPVTLVVCGTAATGKTFLASHLARGSGMTHLNSDLIRKEQWGVAPLEPAPAEAYTETADAAVYAALGEQAARAGSPGVVVDATFRRKRDRDAFAAAYGEEAPPPVFVECRASRNTVRGRANARWWSEEGSVSDADPAQVEQQRAEFAPLDEVDPERHLVVRTDRPIAHVLRDVEGQLDLHMAERRWSLPKSP
jgi:uncharacterized protein